MEGIPFSHPYSRTKTPLFLDLYFKYYDLLRLRCTIRNSICQCIEYGSILEPELPGTHECDLIVIDNEEEKLNLEPKGKIAMLTKMEKFEKLNKEREEIYLTLEKDELSSWEESKYKDQPNNLKKYMVQLRYVEFKFNKLHTEIIKLRKSNSIKDPFEYLSTKYELMEEEIELLIFLYFSNFNCADAIRGDTLLNVIIGKQWKLFNIQNILFEDSSLIKNNLIQMVRKGYDTLSSCYAISNYSNLIISDLHPDFKHLTGKLIKHGKSHKR
jgi:hypothetical protein